MANICDLNNQKAKIEYPLFWGYKVIVLADVDIKALAKQIVGDKDHKISKSNASKDGKYQSYDVSVFVLDERERLEIFVAFKNIAKYVL